MDTKTDRFAQLRRPARTVKAGETLYYQGAYRRVVSNTPRKCGQRDLVLDGVFWPVRVPGSARVPVFFGC